MAQLIEGFRTLPPYGLGAVLILVLYTVQTEIRFGTKARSHSMGAADRGSTVALSLAALVPVLGFVLAMKATLRERYTRTLLTHDQHAIERSGPYRWVRHPGYLGSLLCLNGIATASGSVLVLMASLLTTGVAYAYRIRVEDEMLARTFGEQYAAYRRDVHAVIPFVR